MEAFITAIRRVSSPPHTYIHMHALPGQCMKLTPPLRARASTSPPLSVVVRVAPSLLFSPPPAREWTQRLARASA